MLADNALPHALKPVPCVGVLMVQTCRLSPHVRATNSAGSTIHSRAAHTDASLHTSALAVEGVVAVQGAGMNQMQA